VVTTYEAVLVLYILLIQNLFRVVTIGFGDLGYSGRVRKQY